MTSRAQFILNMSHAQLNEALVNRILEPLYDHLFEEFIGADTFRYYICIIPF